MISKQYQLDILKIALKPVDNMDEFGGMLIDIGSKIQSMAFTDRIRALNEKDSNE